MPSAANGRAAHVPGVLVWADWHKMHWPAIVLAAPNGSEYEVQFLGAGITCDRVQHIQTWQAGLALGYQTEKVHISDYRAEHRKAIEHGQLWLELTEVGWTARVRGKGLQLLLLPPGVLPKSPFVLSRDYFIDFDEISRAIKCHIDRGGKHHEEVWVRCDKCDKWRHVEHEVLPPAGSRWHCTLNNNKKFSTCSSAQQFSDVLIDARLSLAKVKAKRVRDERRRLNLKRKHTGNPTSAEVGRALCASNLATLGAQKAKLVEEVGQVFSDSPEMKDQASKNARNLLAGTHGLKDPKVCSVSSSNGRAVVFLTSRGVYLVMFASARPGHGLGRKLMGELIEFCKKLGRQRLIVSLQRCLRECDGFYKKMGFRMGSDANVNGMAEWFYPLTARGEEESAQPETSKSESQSKSESVKLELDPSQIVNAEPVKERELHLVIRSSSCESGVQIAQQIEAISTRSSCRKGEQSHSQVRHNHSLPDRITRDLVKRANMEGCHKVYAEKTAVDQKCRKVEEREEINPFMLSFITK